MRRHFSRIPCVDPCRAVGCRPAERVIAQQGRIDPSLYSGLRWRMIGPFRGGRRKRVSGGLRPAQRVLHGIGRRRVWKTTNAAATWLPIFDSQPIASIGAVAVAPSRPDVVYVGTARPTAVADLVRQRMYKSTDAGKTWTHIGLEPDAADWK